MGSREEEEEAKEIHTIMLNNSFSGLENTSPEGRKTGSSKKNVTKKTNKKNPIGCLSCFCFCFFYHSEMNLVALAVF